MFAISYVTENFKNVYLARDMFGQKPLYYRIIKIIGTLVQIILYSIVNQNDLNKDT